MPVQGFTHRRINVTFSLGAEPGVSSAQDVQVTGLRTTARVLVAGGAGMASLNLRMYGLSLDLMNQLSTLGVTQGVVRRNSVTVEAGDDQNGMSKIYQGTIQQGWADPNLAPDVSFNVVAQAGLYPAMAPAAPTSLQGDSDAAQVMSQLAQKMGLTFENGGVSGVMLSNLYLPGTLRTQAQKLAEAGRFNWLIHNGKLSIWPTNGNLPSSGIVPVISKDTGMIGFPSYTAQGVVVRTLFNPNLLFGTQVQVKSDTIPVARGQSPNASLSNLKLPVDGVYVVSTLTHDIAAEYPGGSWESEVQLTIPGFITQVR